MDKAVYEEMYQLERRHWWFAAKRRIVLSLLRKFLDVDLSASTARVADLGCGCGMMLCDLTDAGYDAVGVDPSDMALDFCRARGVHAVMGELPGQVDLSPESVDAVLLLDVLEHIDNDKAAFATAMSLLKPGGIAICTVPAYQWMWTGRDKFHHHKRRYSMRQFAEVLLSAKGAEKVLLSFMNTFLFPLALAGRLAVKALRRDDRPTDLSIPGVGLNRVFQTVFQSERHLLTRRLGMPFGLSLVGLVRKVRNCRSN